MSEFRTTYVVHYYGRPCDTVASLSEILRVARLHPVSHVRETVTEWFGTHDSDTRRYRTVSERTLAPSEYAF